ncbi:hypothetical protein [Burkholderia orbicola]|uniref:hypothetical protein n=1 Tax=Burkholderia orbicola TaxID=2978683 RepID=UPI00265ACA83|nr:hypothetical protein [Burkholderia orbicola]
MKNEIVTPTGVNGEAGRRSRCAAIAVRVALACVGALAVQAAVAAPPSPSPSLCNERLTALIVPALPQTRSPGATSMPPWTSATATSTGSGCSRAPTIRARRIVKRRSAG